MLGGSQHETTRAEVGLPLLQTITLGSAAQKIAFFQTKGNIITSYLGGALGVMAGIYTAGGISGETEEGVPALAIPWL